MGLFYNKEFKNVNFIFLKYREKLYRGLKVGSKWPIFFLKIGKGWSIFKKLLFTIYPWYQNKSYANNAF